MFALLGLSLLLLVGLLGLVQSASTTAINGGLVTINSSNEQPLRRGGRVFLRGTAPYYVSGVGGPEGFAYLPHARKQSIIANLRSHGVNGIYFHATRAFGGDGGPTEHLFFSADDKRLDPAKLSALAQYMDQLDQAGIVMWFHTLDDHAKPWGCINDANAADYAAYARDLARAFGGYKHLVWVTQEEYNWQPEQQGCDAAANVRLQNTLAAALRAYDAAHAIGVHHMNGQAFAFGSNHPNVDTFAQQTYVRSANDMHDVAGLQGWRSGVAYVQSEAYSWHGDLLASGSVQELRRSIWATAFSGGSVFVWGAYEVQDPTGECLDVMGRLQRFMNSIRYRATVPLFGADLAARVAGGTEWILAGDAAGVYVLYGDGGNMTTLGVTGVAAGSYRVRWYDPATGRTVSGGVITHSGGALVRTKPAAIGAEAVLYLVRQAPVTTA